MFGLRHAKGEVLSSTPLVGVLDASSGPQFDLDGRRVTSGVLGLPELVQHKMAVAQYYSEQCPPHVLRLGAGLHNNGSTVSRFF